MKEFEWKAESIVESKVDLKFSLFFFCEIHAELIEREMWLVISGLLLLTAVS